ncbi:MAG: SRPBCC family protein [Solirubrobacterales bacterium]
MALPGDEQVPAPGVVITQAVTIAAPPQAVWPWIAQIGQDRGGFYSYEWLENLAGCEMRNADRVHPEWQHRELGEKVPLHPLNGLAVTIFEPGRTLGLEGWGVFHLLPAADGSTRLLARGRIPAGAPSLFYRAVVELPHFVMQRKMLLEIKRLAEAGTVPG